MLAALHISDPCLEPLQRLGESEWREALDYCGRSRLTFALAAAAKQAMPPWVRSQMDDDAGRNALRAAKIEALYRELDRCLTEANIEFIALKGLTHAALFPDPPPRVQYDIDLFIPRTDVLGAQDLLIERGWKPIQGMESFPTDHLPALLRENGWKWRGDYFDPQLPVAVELHFQLWNQRIERLPAPGMELFWERRAMRRVAGIELGMLRPADAAGYAALHLLRHLLRGNVMPFHVYEIACLLNSTADDRSFWHEWSERHSPEMRRLEAAAFRLAREWFGCRAAAPVADEIERLPAGAERWFREYALSPAAARFHPNKDELWLHFSLLESRLDCWRVARRRLLPANLPPRLGLYALRRLWHHVVSLPRAAATALRWHSGGKGLGSQFWWFVISAAVFNFALFIFVLLYNLFLLDLGFREDFVGLVNGAMRAGSLAGTLPAAIVAHRFGLKKTLLVTIAGTAAAEFLRALAGARLPLAALAFVSGAIFSVWAVILAPLIAGAVEEKRRPAAFSVFFACMFAVGIAGNWIGGLLPFWMGGKRAVLLWSAALSAAAVLPALRLKEWPRAPAGGRIWPRSRFLAVYLVPFALWHLATGAFNPFNNVYFARLGFAVQRIGSIFSIAQIVQVGALLLAPEVIRRLGLLGGIVVMMTATAFGLVGLAAQPSGGAAIAAYMAYMSFQWMSEPGLNTLLMNHIDERERSGASALNYLVAFGAQALAAFGAGSLFTQFGYGWTLAGAAALALVAAGLFRTLRLAPETQAPQIDIAQA